MLSRLASEWVDEGASVDFLVPMLSGPPYYPTKAGILRVERDGSIDRRPAADPGNINGLESLVSLYRGISRIGAKYDVVLANQCFTPWAGVFARTGRAKIFYYIQAYEPDFYNPLRQPVHWLLAKTSYLLPTNQIVNSPLYHRYKGIRSPFLVPPGLDLVVFYPKKALKKLKSAETIVLGCIGRHEPIKGTTYAVKAFERLWVQDKRYRLRVAFGNLPIGWSHPAAEIVAIQNDRELADFYRSLDVMIAPGTGQHGGAHYPVMEAMACGVPVVTTGYLPANQHNSWIVANKNVGAICDAVKEIVSDPGYENRPGLALKDIAAFDWKTVAGKMLLFFREESQDTAGRAASTRSIFTFRH